jgi:hypothetical protein
MKGFLFEKIFKTPFGFKLKYNTFARAFEKG